MLKQPSPAKLAANRKNAQNSTGPRTPHGKARVAKNAVKHGLFAAEAVVTDADGPHRPQEFRALLADLLAEFDPKTRLDYILVERLAVCFWRLRRAQHAELAALHDAIDQRPEDPAEIEAEKIGYELDRARMLRNQDVENLRFLRELDVTDPHALRRAAPVFNRLRLRYSRDVLDLPDDRHVREVLLDKLPHYIEEADRETIPDIEQRLERASENARLSRERRARTAVLPSPEEVLKLVRYENMLDRHLHRALTHLLRRQERAVLHSEPRAPARIPSSGCLTTE